MNVISVKRLLSEREIKLLSERVLPVSYFLLADSAGLLLCNDTFNLLMEDSLLLHLKKENMQVSRGKTFISNPKTLFHLHFNTNVQKSSLTEDKILYKTLYGTAASPSQLPSFLRNMICSKRSLCFCQRSPDLRDDDKKRK